MIKHYVSIQLYDDQSFHNSSGEFNVNYEGLQCDEFICEDSKIVDILSREHGLWYSGGCLWDRSSLVIGGHCQKSIYSTKDLGIDNCILNKERSHFTDGFIKIISLLHYVKSSIVGRNFIWLDEDVKLKDFSLNCDDTDLILTRDYYGVNSGVFCVTNRVIAESLLIFLLQNIRQKFDSPFRDQNLFLRVFYEKVFRSRVVSNIQYNPATEIFVNQSVCHCAGNDIAKEQCLQLCFKNNTRFIFSKSLVKASSGFVTKFIIADKIN